MVERRIGWRVDVLRCCNNWEDIVSTDRKVLSNFCNPKVFHFPKKWRIAPVFLTRDGIYPMNIMS